MSDKPYEQLINAAKPSGASKLVRLRDYRLGTHWQRNDSALKNYTPEDNVVWFECAVVTAFVHLLGSSVEDIRRSDIKITPEEQKTLEDFRALGQRVAGLVFSRERGRLAALTDSIRQRAADAGHSFT